MDELTTTEQTDSNTLLAEIDGIKIITSPDQYSRAATLRGLVKDMMKAMEDDAKPSIEEAKVHLNNLRTRLAEKVDPLNLKYKALGGLLVNYDVEQQRIKRQKELEIEAEQRRKAKEEQDQLAKLAKEMGNKELAKEIKAAPIEVAPVVVTAATPTAKETGVSFREDWVNFQLEDLKKVPMEYHLLNEVAVRKVVRALKGATNITGIKVLPPNKVPIQR
jgi:hypothetical protein